jgi:hypothetical protein
MLVKNVMVRNVCSIAAASLIFVGCGPSEEILQQLAQAEIVAAQKDSLVEAVAEYAQVMSVISSELAAVELEGREMLIALESPLAASRDSIVEKIRSMDERMAQSAQRLQQSRRRIGQLTQLSDSLRASMENTISNYESVLATHRESIASLTEQVAGLETETQRLASEIGSLESEIGNANVVYYTIATKEELLERGIIEKQGGARVLFIFGKRGETLVPGRDLDPSMFTAIDSRAVTEIPVPNPNAAYSIVSRHSLSFLENTPDEDGKISGTVRITSPSEFWAASTFLILIEEVE